MRSKGKTIFKKTGFPAILLIAACLLPFVVPSNKQAYVCQTMCSAMIYLVGVYGLNFVTGMSGQINIGMAGTFCLGAYTSGILTTTLGISPWLAIIGVVIMGVIVGLIIGYPSLRVRGIYLALTSIAFTEIIRKLVTNLTDLTGGSMGLKSIPKYNFFGISLSTPFKFYFFMIGVILVLSLLCAVIIRSKWGRAFYAVKDDDTAAEACGINITTVKLTAFVLSAVFGCLAGALFAHNQSYLSPSTFTVDMSFTLIVMLAFGGSGNIYGCMIGAVLITVLPEALRFLGEYYQIVYAAIVLVVSIFVPGGLLSICKQVWKETKKMLPSGRRNGEGG